MEHAKEVQALVKKTKLQNAKEMFKLLMAEDPLLTFTIMAVITTFYPTLLTMLAQALLQNNRTQIYLIFQVLIGITIVIMALLFLRGILLNRTLKTKAETTTIQDLAYLKKYHEQEKHKRFAELSQAKSDNMKAQTNFIMGLSENALVKMMQHKADNLQQGFSRENIQETMNDILGTLGKVIVRFNGIDAQYDQAIVQINEICDHLKIKIEDLVIEPMIDPKTSTQGLQDKFDEALSEIPEPDKPPIFKEKHVSSSADLSQRLPSNEVEGFIIAPPMWTCAKCKKEYNNKVRKCKCGKTRPF